MPCCFCLGCKTGKQKYYKNLNPENKIPSLFKAPKDIDLLEKWKKAIPHSDREFSAKDYVCALHFDSEDIEDYFEVKLRDGTVWRQKRERVKLKADAVPCKFPNLSGHVSFQRKKRKLPCKILNTTGVVIKLENNEHHEINFTEDTSTNFDSKQGIFSFEKLKACLHSLVSNSNWTFTIAPDFISFLLWDTAGGLDRWITIHEDFSTKVFLKGKEMALKEIDMFSSDQDVKSFLHEVEKYMICLGINKYSDCPGCLESSVYCKKIGYCKSCRRNLSNETGKRKALNSLRLAQKRHLLHCALRKNIRLRAKVRKLGRQVTLAKKEYADFKKSVFDEIEKQPLNLQKSIKACMKAALSKKKQPEYSIIVL